MKNKIKSYIAFNDTKVIRKLNLSISFLLLCGVLLQLITPIRLSLLVPLTPTLPWIIIFSCIIVWVSVAIDHLSGRARQLSKCFSMLIGSLLQIIIADAYLGFYIPHTFIAIVCFAICLWLLWSVIYVVKVEGMYDN